MIKINLLPDLVLQRRKEARVKKMATFALMAWTGLIVFILVLAISYGQYQKFTLAKAEESRQELDLVVNSPENVEFREEALAVQNSLNALQELFLSRQSAAEFFEVLAAAMPDSVRIVELGFNDQSSVSIVGSARSFDSVSALEAAMKKTADDYEAWLASGESDTTEPPAAGYFTDVELLGASLSDGNEIRFELQAVYLSADTGGGDVNETIEGATGE